MKRFATVGLVLSMVATMLVGCSECYEKMQKKQDQIQFTCTPDLLTLKGSTVEADLTVTFPEMYFNTEAILKITPVFVYNDGEEIACAPKFLQGERVTGNYTQISRFDGGSYSQHISFPFKKGVVGSLELRIESKCFDDCKETPDFVPFATYAVASGIAAHQTMAHGIGDELEEDGLSDAEALAQGVERTKEFAQELVLDENNIIENEEGTYELILTSFERSATTMAEAEIKYTISSSQVRKQQLSQEQITLFKDFIAANQGAERITVGNVYASGYASPDGSEKFNATLSEKRSESGAKAMKKELKGVEGVNFEIASYGEDWDGFVKLVEMSDIQDKDLILNVLRLYTSAIDREAEIKNMAEVFKVLAEEILPELRRTRFAVQATYAGLTDEEILAAAKAGDTNLDNEHMLYAATLTNNLGEKTVIYAMAANTYGDPIAYNNLGVCLVANHEVRAAKVAFEKASELPEAAANVAAISLNTGDDERARRYVENSTSIAAEATRGAIYIFDGEYQEAKEHLAGYNLAIAELCDNNVEGAREAIKGVKGADADYVRAIIAMKEGEVSEATALLKQAVKAKPELKEVAKNDITFYEIINNI